MLLLPAKADSLPDAPSFSDLAEAPAAATLRFEASFFAVDSDSDKDCEVAERLVFASADFVGAAAVDFAWVFVWADGEEAVFFAVFFFAASFFGASFFAGSLFSASLVGDPEENNRVRKFPDERSVLCTAPTD